MIKAVYIHIPFCKQICSYCDFCKMFYNKKFVDNYLNVLEIEIKKYYQKDKIKSLYIGGGTPSCLELDELHKLFKIIKIFDLSQDVEFTFECNIENIDEKKMQFLYDSGVNRLSVGVQTFNSKHLSCLDRKHAKEEVLSKIQIAKRVGFKNINIDLIYALPNQTKEELSEDLSLFLNLDIPHISTYSLIVEPHTKMYVNNTSYIDEDLDFEMYNLIKKTLENKGYTHYETSNFAKENYQSKHNLNYWNNEEYYGFGLGASGYVDNVRYDNTRSLNNYLNGQFRLNEELIDEKIKIENELILGFRKLKGINKKDFYNKYNINITDINPIKKLIEKGKLIDDGLNIYISPEYIYLANEILINFIGEFNE